MGRISGFRLQTAINDLFTGTLGDVNPGIPLTVFAGLTRAGMGAGLTVVLAGLDHAVAALGAFFVRVPADCWPDRRRPTGPE